ncbi:hypothetical protein ACHHYP_16645 [Achlya hypogyna]|uniref:Transmembrane protein n=1 Tax=Achlya hypogyna TaxID=1202772 RepID=A0A1V9Y6A6_ACHHY|nr:hypothetical protein ACHHYP_16645 [Achlya hypogyna]
MDIAGEEPSYTITSAPWGDLQEFYPKTITPSVPLSADLTELYSFLASQKPAHDVGFRDRAESYDQKAVERKLRELENWNFRLYLDEGARAFILALHVVHSTGLSTTIVTSATSRRSADPSLTSYINSCARVCSNLTAGGLILLSLVTLSVLISQGMFDRLVISANAQTEAYFWAPYGQTCMLDTHGFVPESKIEMRATTAAAWTAVGATLAQQWSLELQNVSVLYVTTCIIGGTASVGWANVQFVAGYDNFPDCLPTNGAQLVAGMAMLETTIRDAYEAGVYLLTLYSDLDPAMNTLLHHMSSDGSTAQLMSSPARTIITQDGNAAADASGSDYIIYSYRVMGYCHTEIEAVGGLGLDGWSQGKFSGHAICPGWNCGHQVTNAVELIVLQIVLSLLTIALLSGDIYVTLQGLHGLLHRKPVLTYAVLSGLERRKVLLVLITLNAVPSLLYLDVSRIYFFTQNGFKIWSLSAAMLANFVAFGCLLITSLVGMLPAPSYLKGYCVRFSSPLFLFGTMAGVLSSLCDLNLYKSVYNQFYAAPPYLGLYVNNATWPSGAYVAAGTPAVVTWILGQTGRPLVIAFGVAVVASGSYHGIRRKQPLLSTSWCCTNSFLSHVQVPNYITSLPLEQSNAIKIGNRVFCKPSTMALMGYAVVADDNVAPTDDGVKLKPTFLVVSIYALIPALLLRRWCRAPAVVGVIYNNRFTPTADARLEPTQRYTHRRGTCVN